MTVDKLEALGIEHMSDERIGDFLSSQGVGILALPTDDAPYILPLSFGYDGTRRLFFTYVTGGDSDKATLSARGGTASFLVYTAESPFSWRSVVCRGTLTEVPRHDWPAHDKAMADNAWHPDLFERAFELEDVLVYQFEIEEWSGLRHAGLPPGLDRNSPGDTSV
jgi:nitroimidazol reductase NimA-like FMN-containing flavoprotein (pyridoxamine 5'-phosphate oxidase superfamily)